MSLCRCSILTPTENGFAVISAPRRHIRSNVSRALCPIARITAPTSTSYRIPFDSSAAVSIRSDKSDDLPLDLISTSFVSNLISPPSSQIRRAILPTTPSSRSVPMCGFASFVISSGAPNSRSRSSTYEQCGSFYARHELAVRKGTRAARAELNIRLGIEPTGADKLVYRTCARRNIAAPLDYDRTIALFGEQQSGEHPARTESDDQWSRPKRLEAALYCHRSASHDFYIRSTFQPFEPLCVKLAFDADRIYELGLARLSAARVDRAFVQRQR